MTNYPGTPVNYMTDTEMLPGGPENTVAYAMPPFLFAGMTTFNQGYNYLRLSQANILPTYSMLYTWISDAALYAVDPDADTAHSDMYFTTRRFLSYSSKKQVLLLRVLTINEIDPPDNIYHFSKSINFTKSYKTAGTYTINATFSCHGVTYFSTKSIVVAGVVPASTTTRVTTKTSTVPPAALNSNISVDLAANSFHISQQLNFTVNLISACQTGNVTIDYGDGFEQETYSEQGDFGFF